MKVLQALSNPKELVGRCMVIDELITNRCCDNSTEILYADK